MMKDKFEENTMILRRTIIGVFYHVYNELGPGFLESVYREAMRLALKSGRNEG